MSIDSLQTSRLLDWEKHVAKTQEEKGKVTRISASNSGKKKKAVTASSKKSPVVKKSKVAASTKKTRTLPKPLRILLTPFTAFGTYLKGAWTELNQVHWPTRQATWSLTLAVLLFTLFFVVFIGLLDAGFKYLFELLLG